jgi:hypothetical protein
MPRYARTRTPIRPSYLHSIALRVLCTAAD